MAAVTEGISLLPPAAASPSHVVQRPLAPLHPPRRRVRLLAQQQVELRRAVLHVAQADEEGSANGIAGTRATVESYPASSPRFTA
jgi:hypothetical protein